MDEFKFAVFTDLHYDHIPDGLDRFESFLKEIEYKDIDFIVNLGDFCKPINENKKLLSLLKTHKKPCYHTIGNHDSDSYPKKEVLDFLGLDNSYYSFIYGNVKFIVLDTCFIKHNNKYVSYNKMNYASTTGLYPVLPSEQVKWLESEMDDDCSNYVIFSHHSFENEFKQRGVHNRLEVQKLINDVSNSKSKTILCINGHDHADSLKTINNTHYFGLNGMSYIWFGELCNQRPYSDDLYSKYPGLKDILLYRDALYAVVTINELGTFSIDGMKSDYKTMSPSDLGIEGLWNGRIISPNITSI